MQIKTWDGLVKSALRSTLVSSHKTARVAVFMPGDTAYCVQSAIACGTVGNKTKVVLIDRDYDTLIIAKHHVLNMGIEETKIILFCGEMHRFNVENLEYSRKAYQYHNVKMKNIDFAYFDTCGELKQNQLDFLEWFGQNVDHDCTIAFTLQAHSRVGRIYSTACNDRIKTKISNDKDRENRAMGYASAMLEKLPHHLLTFGRTYKEMGNAISMFSGRLTSDRSPDSEMTVSPSLMMDLGFKK